MPKSLLKTNFFFNKFEAHNCKNVSKEGLHILYGNAFNLYANVFSIVSTEKPYLLFTNRRSL